MSDKRWLEYLPLADLRPDPRNPKAHAVDDLRASMGRWGYVEPVVIDERTGLLVAGHGRRELLLDDLAAGREPPEGVEVADDGSWLVPVNRGWESTDDDEALGYLVASNRIPELGGWATDLLAEGLERLAMLNADGAGLIGVGYREVDLPDLLALAGVTGTREASFLDDLASTAASGGEHGMGGDAPLPLEPTLALSLSFSSREDRERVTGWLRGVMKETGAESMAGALLLLAEREAVQ